MFATAARPGDTIAASAPAVRRLLALVASVLLVTAACGGTGVEEARGERDHQGDGAATAREAQADARGDDLVVMAKLAPIASLVEAVLGERGTALTLVPNGADAHAYEPRPSDVRRLGRATAFFGIGLGLNSRALRLAEASLPAGAPIVLLGESALGAQDRIAGRSGHHHDGDDHSHDHSHGPGDDGGSAPNPHVWIDPVNAIAMVGQIRAELTALDPRGADTFAGNATRLIEEIEAVDAAIAEAAETVPVEHRKLVVHHDAWAYFGPRYGLEVVAALQPVDMAEPTAADVRRIIDQIRREGVPKVFGAVELPGDVLAAIASETGAEHGAELSDDRLPGQPGDPEHSYLGLLARNARAIVEGLGGDPGPIDDIPIGS